MGKPNTGWGHAGSNHLADSTWHSQAKAEWVDRVPLAGAALIRVTLGSFQTPLPVGLAGLPLSLGSVPH